MKQCPFCGSDAEYIYECGRSYIQCTNHNCHINGPVVYESDKYASKDEAIRRWDNRVKKLECRVFDIEEIHPNCTVQVLKNSVTNEVSVGWWENDGD